MQKEIDTQRQQEQDKEKKNKNDVTPSLNRAASYLKDTGRTETKLRPSMIG
jgi:hypothetical protein